MLLGLLALPFNAFSQCAFGGTVYGDATPGGVGQTVSLNNVWAGDQYTLQAQAGCTYLISTCGGNWDSQITVFNPGNVSVAYNDDSCGLQSEVTFTAAVTGTYIIQINQYYCNTNFSDIGEFNVTLVACQAASDCNDPAACNYDPASSSSSGCCYGECATFSMYDSFGDGWNGAVYSITDSDGNSLGGGTLASGSFQEDELCIPEGCITVSVTSGTFPGEVSWVLELSDGTTYSGGAGVTNDYAIGATTDTGCTDPTAINYDPAAICDDGSCIECISTDPSGCPEIELGADIAVAECTDPCTSLTLNAEYFETGETSLYQVCSIPYTPFPYNTGTQFSINTDDVWSGVINLPFDFCFYGNNYSDIIVGSNGVISFDLTGASGYCPWPFTATCPSPALPLNAIYGVYHDIDPSVCGAARYAILGSAPCRVFVVNYDEVCHFSFACNSLTSTTQIVLYETTNVIEVYVEQKETCASWNSGNALIGIQNATGTQGKTPISRQTGPWSASNEAWRFIPSGPTIVDVNWYSQTDGFLGTGASIDVCPDQALQTFVAEAVYTLCDGSTVTVSDNVNVTCAQIMLPVEWLDFQARLLNNDDEVLCYWETATEINNDHFVIERSADLLIWQDVGTVAGAGTTTEPQSYHFIDHHPLPGVSYYRLRQVDHNGAFDHSPVRSVERKWGEFTVYPNPGSGLFRVKGAGHGIVRVVDAIGREVHRQSMLENGELFLDVATGVYYFELLSPSGEAEKRIKVMVVN